MLRPVTSVHVDIARLVLEVSKVSGESTESTEKMRGAWLSTLVEALALRDGTLHPYAKYLLSEVAEYRKADSERKKGKHSKDSVDSVDSLPRSDQSITDQIKKEEKKEKKRTPRTTVRFVPPSIEEVRAYCQERGNSIDPETWWNHYNSNGWKVGKNPMTVWKSAVITWEKKERKNGFQSAQHESAVVRNGRRFEEELGKIAAGIGAGGDHEILPLLPETDA